MDPYTANKLLAKKPDGEREFSESMHRFEIAKGHLSDALETMRGKFLDSTRKMFEGTFILAECAHQICRCFHQLSFKKYLLCLNLLFVCPFFKVHRFGHRTTGFGVKSTWCSLGTFQQMPTPQQEIWSVPSMP